MPIMPELLFYGAYKPSFPVEMFGWGKNEYSSERGGLLGKTCEFPHPNIHNPTAKG